ncbi:unnamed protein product [Pleuronectes platessa]|uniref:Uncharacterized protein n=1 Tax=Pleuronectes platessa TaxID=8262 RepID=A0A9N7V3W6_PLEPL|nr:unnamed protein product [Pleuronectes platessa]
MSEPHPFGSKKPLTVWPLCRGDVKVVYRLSVARSLTLGYVGLRDPGPPSPGWSCPLLSFFLALTLDLLPCCHQGPRWPYGHKESKWHKASFLQAVCALSCLLSGLAYRLEPVSARYQGPHTHTHYIPPLTARGEGEVLDEVRTPPSHGAGHS